jgi:L-ascorbate metabolism protein UlaG (beta-lactamase superfamily)
MHLTWFGHASVRIETKEGVVIYVDPYAGDETWYDKAADIVLVTHADYDHFKMALLKRIRVDDTVIFSTRQVCQDVDGAKPVWPGEKHVVKGVTITAVDAYTLQGKHEKGEGVGFIIECEGRKVYVAGDTDFIPEMRKFRADIVFLPVGGTFTMGAKDAAQIVLGMKPEHAIPYHWGSIVGSIDDARDFKELVDTAGHTVVHIMSPSQMIEV